MALNMKDLPPLSSGAPLVGTDENGNAIVMADPAIKSDSQVTVEPQETVSKGEEAAANIETEAAEPGKESPLQPAPAIARIREPLQDAAEDTFTDATSSATSSSSTLSTTETLSSSSHCTWI